MCVVGRRRELTGKLEKTKTKTEWPETEVTGKRQTVRRRGGRRDD